jgi:hypothetical protein
VVADREQAHTGLERLAHQLDHDDDAL